ncbi:MMPL family transporter [Candidatus Mycobacterium wuenschmannii]|uniref:MMPL family transporter n=1 Tax=Candidatus Mycobacterium wuenschmannii TaxID=3027808 RepID=A0ABY8W0K0_9MYCO|nr:MMPL family transporter [Candidatus Mycobacterium wuenschmannii]WIM88750.1 MMPL family transporter [Candidatus Mycobacterium wuenschmannii]
MADGTGVFGWIGVVVRRWPWAVVGFWIALTAVLSMTFPSLTEMAAKRPVPILPPDAPVLQTTKQISEAYHQNGSENENVLLVVLTDDNGLNPSDLTTYRTLAENLRPDTRDIVLLQDFVRTPALRDAMTSKDHKAWYLPMVLSGGVGTPELHEGFGRVADIVKKSVAGTTLTAHLTGPAATGDDLMYIGIRDMHVIETAVVVMVLVILFVIYRNLLTMMLPLMTIGLSVGVAQALVSGVAQLGLGVSTQTITLMTTMMFGAGIDYAVFLISRYHDYLRQGLDSDDAVERALTSIGKVIAGSAATVAVTFLGMIFTKLGAFRNVGPALAISIAVALFAAVTFLPALMVLAGRRNWIKPRRDLTGHFWRVTGIRIVRKPIIHLAGSLTVLLILAVCGMFARFNYDDSKTLPDSVESSVGYSTLAEHFPLNATIPEYLVVHSSEDLRKRPALVELKQMEQRVSQLPDIAAIHPAPVPSAKSNDKKSAASGELLPRHDKGSSSGNKDLEGAEGFPNVAALLYSVSASGNVDLTPDLSSLDLPPGVTLPTAPPEKKKEVDDTNTFVNTVRGLGFAMSVDIAEIANTVGSAPVTVLDVVATANRDGGALKKMSEFAEQLSSFPDEPSIEAASREVRRIVENARTEIRSLSNDPPSAKDAAAPPPKDPHNYADAIQQMIDEVKALIKDTSQTGGGLNSALTAFISPDGHTARYLVQTKLNPFATEAFSQIREITDAARGPHPRALMKEASISASGVTAMLRDTRAYYGDDINLIIVMTILIVFLILVAILRAVVAPLYLIASVVLSYLSALGLGVIVFQFMLGQPLTWSIPGLTFIVLVAMGADYNLLLISRLREESPHGIRSGVIQTVRSTGGVITAAGVIFAASMFGMLFASISTLVQCGFIIGTGLLLDTFLVRTITVPAIAVLVGKWNWWPSKPPPPAARERPIPLSQADAQPAVEVETKAETEPEPAPVVDAAPESDAAPETDAEPTPENGSEPEADLGPTLVAHAVPTPEAHLVPTPEVHAVPTPEVGAESLTGPENGMPVHIEDDPDTDAIRMSTEVVDESDPDTVVLRW